MALIQGIVDTQKQNLKSLGIVNSGDDLTIELEVKQNGVNIEFVNPIFELLATKSDGTRVRQLVDITYIGNVVNIIGDEQLVTSPGIVTLQLIIKDNKRSSTCLFYFMCGTSLDRDIIQSISKVEVLNQLDEYVVQAFANLKEYEQRIIASDASIRNLNEDMIKAEKVRVQAEINRGNTFDNLVLKMNNAINAAIATDETLQNNEIKRIDNYNTLKAELESIKDDLILLNNNISKEEEKRVQAEINRVNKTLEIIEKLKSTNDKVTIAEAERVTEFNNIKSELTSLKEALTTINNIANSNEEIRKTNESGRVAAEQQRVTDFEKIKSDNTSLGVALTKKVDDKIVEIEANNNTFKQGINEQYDTIITKNTEFKEQMNTDFGNAKTDYFGEEHLNVVDRLNSDFDNVHQRINDSSYLEYSGSSIKADNTYYGLTKELSLNGRTLHNLNSAKVKRNFNLQNDDFTEQNIYKPFGDFIKANTKYTVILSIKNVVNTPQIVITLGTTNKIVNTILDVSSTGVYVNTITSPSEVDSNSNNIRIPLKYIQANNGATIDYCIILEGDYTNVDFPINYFEGITSVGESEVTEDGKYKISGKSCGKNLINTRKLTPTGSNMASVEINEDIIKVSALTESGTHKYIKYEFDLKPTCKYTFTSKYTTSNSNANPRARIFASTTEDKAITTNGGNVTITTDSTGHVILYLYATFTNAVSTITEFKIQLEEGTVATDYEPYQESNFELLLDEPLRSLPNGVADEITEDGEEIRRVVKFIMNDETCKNVSVWHNTTASFNYIRFYIYYRQIPEGVIGVMNSSCLNDKYVAKGSPYGNEFESCNCVNDYIGVSIKVSEIPNFYDMTLVEKTNAVREWLKENPITVYYQALEPIITKHNKNIKLKTFEGKTHITSDNYLLPTLSCKVPSNVQAVVSSLMLENEALNGQVSTLNLENENLKTTNDIQDELIDTTMLATDEMYMMIEPLLSEAVQTLSLERSVSKMVDMYVAMVQRGLKTIDEVPARYREQVKEILAQLEK